MRMLVLALIGMLAAAPLAAGTAVPVLVSPEWLAGHLEDPDLVVLHVAQLRSDYDREHIPGARFVWFNYQVGDLIESTPGGSYDLPAPKVLHKRLERLGISSGSRIVICHALGNSMAAARTYATLDEMGLGERTSILDGGFEAWKGEGRPVTTAEPRVRRGRLGALSPGRAFVGIEEVVASYRAPGVQLVDGRPKPAYDGASGLGIFRSGHIPGAVCVPYNLMTDKDDRYLSADSLRTLFERAGVKPGERLIAYCGVGAGACPVYVAAKILGYDVRLYDGSYEQWSRRLDLPVDGKAAAK